jgi:hypothetical protein
VRIEEVRGLGWVQAVVAGGYLGVRARSGAQGRQTRVVDFGVAVRRMGVGGNRPEGDPMAQYAIFLYAPNVDIDEEPAPGKLEKHYRHADELISEGTMIAGFRLQPITASTSIRSDGLTDGPFLEAKQVILGFYVIEASDLDAALKTAKRNPILTQGGGLEGRPVIT